MGPASKTGHRGDHRLRRGKTGQPGSGDHRLGRRKTGQRSRGDHRLRPPETHPQSLGQRPARVQALAAALFAAHFQQGRDIGDSATLADIAAECGERRAEVLAYLDGDADAAGVQRMAARLRQQGVEGVPFYIFNRRLAMSGAQSAAVLGAAILQSLQAAPAS